ncbi:hypothetical protein TWF225_009029 [Orbilia oligospora]|uniref:Uncharacterized protein n=1 Tax=Orbilia oligospora TaxID=2813651 RepID=A0A7C8PLE3_ORBOL|nr:hypothetical protein TWF751_006215 [Orbilia oligospora]KAF3175134.1 hypothetical protein TWF225_009029 [Orbilia oligospora]KAF3241749.1 hypothetical protein TWF128_010740 [Orbilia oligospora]KAF3248693.1 hypothetical protein TWF217_009050 [Orbilia oligospora]KAF3292599.1 hypothetical protein TWF132_005643 [Orbilia oligospora]
MTEKLSLEDSESDYIESSAESSSSSSSSASKSAESSPERATSLAAFSQPKPSGPANGSTNGGGPKSNLEEEDDYSDDHSGGEDEEESKKEETPWNPYSHSKANVFTASSSLVTVTQRSLSQRHSKPAGADEILFHNPMNPGFVLPDSVKSILEDEKIMGDLPDSDLLKAVHRYASEFFDAKGWDGVMARSLDESALLAIGVILEEYCREMVGKDGGMVFAE